MSKEEVLTLCCLGSYYEWLVVGYRSVDGSGIVTIRDARVIKRFNNQDGGAHGLATNPELIEEISRPITTYTTVIRELWYAPLDESVWLDRYNRA